MSARGMVASAAAVMAVAMAARADDMSGSFGMGAGPNGVDIRFNVNDPGMVQPQGQVVVNGTAAKHEEQTVNKPGESYKITWDSEPSRRTQFKVLAPESFGVRVTDGGAAMVQDTVPVSFDAQPGHFYRVEIFTSQAVLFDHKFEAKAGMVAQLWVNAGAPPQQQVAMQVNAGPGGGGVYVGGRMGGTVVVTGAEPMPMAQPMPMPVASTCMDGGDFGSIRSAIGEESFSNEKLRVLETALADRRVCVQQVIETLGLFDFGNDKIAALKMLAPRINDSGNKFKIYSAFTFDSEKAQAKAILR